MKNGDEYTNGDVWVRRFVTCAKLISAFTILIVTIVKAGC